MAIYYPGEHVLETLKHVWIVTVSNFSKLEAQNMLSQSHVFFQRKPLNHIHRCYESVDRFCVHLANNGGVTIG